MANGKYLMQPGDDGGHVVGATKVLVKRRGWWRRLMAFAGPAYLVSVGYMDPGNWASGSQARPCGRGYWSCLWLGYWAHSWYT